MADEIKKPIEQSEDIVQPINRISELDNGTPKDIPLSETEILKIENFELKMNSLRQSVATMQTEYQRYLEGLHGKYDLQPGQQLAIDPRSGVARAVDGQTQSQG